MNFALNLQLCPKNNESILSAARKNNRQCLWAWAARDSTSYAGPAGDSPAASGWHEGIRSRTACAGSRLRAKVWARADPAQAVRDLIKCRLSCQPEAAGLSPAPQTQRSCLWLPHKHWRSPSNRREWNLSLYCTGRQLSTIVLYVCSSVIITCAKLRHSVIRDPANERWESLQLATMISM